MSKQTYVGTPKTAWSKSTEDERKTVVKQRGLINANGYKNLMNYHDSMRPKRVERILSEIALGVRPHLSGTCAILTAHSQLLKDDPDKLTTEFLQNLIQSNCKDVE